VSLTIHPATTPMTILHKFVDNFYNHPNKMRIRNTVRTLFLTLFLPFITHLARRNLCVYLFR
jgi:hypothetical protein